jgi:hypothetical protein
MRIDHAGPGLRPRSLHEQLSRVVRYEESLAQLAYLHWATWDGRHHQASRPDHGEPFTQRAAGAKGVGRVRQARERAA